MSGAGSTPPGPPQSRAPGAPSPTWHADPPAPVAIDRRGHQRAAFRALLLLVLHGVCLTLLLLLRLVERPLCGLRRPVTPHITQFVCRNALRIMGIGYVSEGEIAHGRAAVVANHSSWLDIFVLNARKRIYFVSKAEVARWPGIGLLARATGTVFIERDRRHAQAQKAMFEQRLSAGHKLLFFPEGTSTDGRRVLPFKSTLFAAFVDKAHRDEMQVQPVSVTYHAPKGADPRFYGWWGDMGFGSHLYQVLAARHQGWVEVVYHPPLRVADYPDRKALARACEAAVRAGLRRPDLVDVADAPGADRPDARQGAPAP